MFFFCDKARAVKRIFCGKATLPTLPNRQQTCSYLAFSEYGTISIDNINLPEPEPLRDDDRQTPIPYMFVGDEAFPLKPYLMRPFPGRSLDSQEKRIFNYRLSRARRVIENAFGMHDVQLSAQYEVLDT